MKSQSQPITKDLIAQHDLTDLWKEHRELYAIP